MNVIHQSLGDKVHAFVAGSCHIAQPNQSVFVAGQDDNQNVNEKLAPIASKDKIGLNPDFFEKVANSN